MSHLNEQRAFATALFAAAGQVVREINAEAAARHAARPMPSTTPQRQEPIHLDDPEPSDFCQCHAVRFAPCSWCTSDDNPLNAEETNP